MGAIRSVENEIVVPAKTGASTTLRKGQLLRLTDLEGRQPIDFWAFSKENPWEYLSCEHTKTSIQRLYPRQGDSAYTNYRRPIVNLVEDNSPGQHDMESAACDQARYKELGGTVDHPNCQDNLHLELKKLGLGIKGVFQPWNLFTNFLEIDSHVSLPTIMGYPIVKFLNILISSEYFSRSSFVCLQGILS